MDGEKIPDWIIDYKRLEFLRVINRQDEYLEKIRKHKESKNEIHSSVSGKRIYSRC